MKLNDFLTSIVQNKLYIYGAGLYGYYTLKYIYENFDNVINVEAVVVSSYEENYNNIFGVPVRSVNQIQDLNNQYIIIATAPSTANAILDYLINCKKCCKDNIFVFDNEEYRNIRRCNPSVIYETRQELRKIQKYIDKKQSVNKFLNLGQDKARYKNDFIFLKENPELLKKKIMDLNFNMDSQSIFEVNRIIDRLHKMVENKPIILTDEEIKERIERECLYRDNILKLTDDLFYANGFYFSINNPSISGFFDENWKEKIKNIDYLQNKDVIDAGAFVGDTSLIFSKYTNGRIHAFEPDESNFKIVQKTAELNQSNRIIPVNAALTDFEGEVQFIMGLGRDSEEGINGGNGLGTIEKRCAVVNSELTVTVPAMTIDKYVSDNNLRIGLIKTDVEGAEQSLLRGAIETIKNQKPILMISIYHSLSDFFDIKTWIESLNLGYKFTIHRTVVDHSFMNETMLICESV